MPEDVVAGLIAHELAHVVLLAQGDRSRGGLCEYRTDELTCSWGYAPEEIDVWYTQHVRRRTRRGIEWYETPLPREQVVRSVKRFELGNYNGRYVTRQGIPILIDVAASARLCA